MTPGIGHNGGPDTAGRSWRRHVWTRARADLLPKLPLEVVRLRVKRARALGLPYKTYAGIRASSGHDLVGFLFSSNGLEVLRPGQGVPASIAAHLAGLRDCARLGLAVAPVSPAQLADAPLDTAHPAPRPLAGWAEARTAIRAICQAEGAPADRFVLVGGAGFERDWAEAAQLAGFLSGAAVFGAGAAIV